jgi:hypothetical protein
VVALPAPASKNVPRAAQVVLPLVSEDALDQVRAVAPGWDRQFLAARYRAWMKGKAHPRNPDAAFLGWVKKFTKAKAP